jgi:hypothetical protein
MPKPSNRTQEIFAARTSDSRSSRRKEAHFKCWRRKKLEPRYLGCYDRLIMMTQFLLPVRKMISHQPGLCYKR